MIFPRLALALLVASLCVDATAAFTASPVRLGMGLRLAARMPSPARSVQLSGPQPTRGRAAKLPLLSSVRAETEEAALVPPPKEIAGAYISSMDQYEKMYRQSLDDPEVIFP